MRLRRGFLLFFDGCERARDVKSWLLLLPTLALLGWVSGAKTALASAPASASVEGFVAVNGVRLQYLDWGGAGPALILIHGLGDNPHVFDDLAPAFTDRFHVIAYARRGSGSSDSQGPYDVNTLTEDLRGLLDALRISQADLVGYSAGGDEITQMAAAHPERVLRIVYLDAGYDWTDPDFRAAVRAQPVRVFDRPARALASPEAYRAYQQALWYPDLDDMSRIRANIAAKIVIQRNGTVSDRIPAQVMGDLYSALTAGPRRAYSRVRCPALAIYADSEYNLQVRDRDLRRRLATYENGYWKPFQEKSRELIRHELANVQIAQVTGAHGSFLLTDREHVVALMRAFLERRIGK